MPKSIVVPGMSWAQVESIARNALATLAPNSAQEPIPPNMIQILEVDLFQKYGIDFGVEELPYGTEARFDPDANCIILAESTYRDLCANLPRARFTVAHEIGHAIMHAPYLKEILDGNRKKRVLNRGEIPAYANPEMQANRFASELLMPSQLVRNLILQGKNVHDLSKIFQVSFDAASIKFKNVCKQFGLAVGAASPNSFF